MAELIGDVPLRATIVLVDTNAIIEAVRTGTWNALTGALLLETVDECRHEALRGDSTRPAYVPVTEQALARLHAVHAVTEEERAAYLLADPEAIALDAGERDLFAHAFARASRGDRVWVLCSADKAALRAALRIAIDEQLRSLAKICEAAGARPKVPLKAHFLEQFLLTNLIAFRLGG